ncbi:hypothetical protein CRE_21062 [Caenorhabditis remanei]|uniref:Uncharacterized protein n=1 Tax=Caenorhabditis remanei TaxID=31234 RepID=E3NQG7_CAERE|nr:hypothetical protein CRE_21062 [Caenorhabditis remanei]
MLNAYLEPTESFIARIVSLDASMIAGILITGNPKEEHVFCLALFMYAYVGLNMYVSENPPLEDIRSVGYYKRKIRIAIIGSIAYIISHIIILNLLDLSGWTYYTIFCLLNVFFVVFYIRYTWKIMDFSGFNLKYGYFIGPSFFAFVSILVRWYQNPPGEHIVLLYALLHCIYDFCLTFKYFCIELPGPEETLLQRIKTE